MKPAEKKTALLGEKHISTKKGEITMTPDQLERIKRNLNTIIGGRERMLQASFDLLTSGSAADGKKFKAAAQESQSVLFATPITIDHFEVPVD